MTILEFALKQGYQTVKKSGTWRGYTVYTPGYDDGATHYTGLPYVILVKDGKARMSTPKETIDYMAETNESE